MQPIALAHWAHDIRNTLGTLALYLESLERPSEPDTIRIVTCSNALLKKAAGMCSELMLESARADPGVQRRRFDVMQTIRKSSISSCPSFPSRRSSMSWDAGRSM